MRLPRTVRTDLVISMTLAEIFLLLLFVVWYSLTNPAVARPFPDPWERIKALEAERDKLAADLARAQKSADELQRLTDFWQQNFGMDIPGTKEAVKEFVAEAGRGYPKCQDNNLLVRVSVLNGDETMVLTADSPSLWQFFISRGISRPAIGVQVPSSRLTDFLAGVSDYYQAKSRESRGCRFDYWLTYATAEDYLYGRRKFEDYFYAGRITSLKTAPK
jgi:hypothetical protein